MSVLTESVKLEPNTIIQSSSDNLVHDMYISTSAQQQVHYGGMIIPDSEHQRGASILWDEDANQ